VSGFSLFADAMGFDTAHSSLLVCTANSVCCLTADAISESIQQTALQAGGFAAVAAPLQQEELAAGTLAGGLYRGLLLQGVCLMAAAFDLSPWRLPGPVLQQLLDLMVAVVAGGWCQVRRWSAITMLYLSWSIQQYLCCMLFRRLVSVNTSQVVW
jgi:hypothetical protein